jgi:hypothetical protein
MAFKFRFGKRNLDSKELRDAERLVGSKKFTEAIDALTQANKTNPSASIERRLVEIRHEAFFHQTFNSEFETWPPKISDQFIQATGIPEITKSQFNGEVLRDGVFTHGSIIVRDLLDERDVNLLRTGIQETYKHHDLHSSGSSLEETQPWFVPFVPSESQSKEVIDRYWYREGGAELAADSPRGLFNLIECFEKYGIIDLVTEYLGERPALSVRKTSLRIIPYDLNVDHGWHQDGAFLGKGIRTMNLWIALTDCGIDAPSMDMVPMRLDHIVPTGTEGAYFDWSISSKMIEEVCGGKQPTHLHFKAGDAIIFDEMNLHRTSTLPGMTKNRFAIEAWFFAPSCYPLDQLPILL